MRQKVWTDLGEALAQRSYVYRLDLSRQRLKLLPAEIGKLNKVETCRLSENDLSGWPPTERPGLRRLPIIPWTRTAVTHQTVCSLTMSPAPRRNVAARGIFRSGQAAGA